MDRLAEITLLIWHTEGTAISGLLSWMWRLKKSLPLAGIRLVLVSLEIRPPQFPQVCGSDEFYDVIVRTPQEFLVQLKKYNSAWHLINHAYEYVDLLHELNPGLLKRTRLLGICHTDQEFYYANLCRLDAHLKGIIAVSEHCRSILEGRLPHRAGTIPIFPDWEMPIPDVPERVLKPSKPLKLFFNGRLIHLQKRVLELPQIGRELVRLGTEVELTVVGDGPDKNALLDRMKEIRNFNFTYLGQVPPWEMDNLMKEQDVFLQVSEFEGASVSLMEAMARGLVPVVTKTASGVDSLQDETNCLMAPIGQPELVAKQIHRIATETQLWAALRRNAFESAIRAISELKYADRMRSYLSDLES